MQLVLPRAVGRIIFVLASPLFLISCIGSPSEVPTGAWTGDVNWPGGTVPGGVTWHVDRSDSTGSLTIALESPGLSRTASVPLNVYGDRLRFQFPYQRFKNTTCDVRRRPSGRWRGACAIPANDRTVDITMVPPNRSLPVGYARVAIETLEGDWQRTTAGRAIVYTRPGTEAHDHLDRVTDEARSAVSRVVDTLRAPGWTGPVRFVYVDSRETIKDVTGRPARGSADAGGNAVLLVTDEEGGTPVHHEMVHVVSMRQWGTAHDPGGWIQEGVAEWAQGGHCGAVPHGRLDRYLHRRGDGLPLDTLTYSFWEHSDRITMPQVTTLVQYIVDEHGFKALRGLWDGGIGASKQVVGIDTKTLDAKWRDWVRAHYEPASAEDWQASMGREKGCPFSEDRPSVSE